MYLQDILRYAGIVLLFLGAVLAVLSIVDFVTRDVRGALRFLRGETSGGTVRSEAESEKRRVAAIHRSHAVTRETRDSLAEAESSRGVARDYGVRLQDNGPRDMVQDALDTIVKDSGQDVLSTIVSDADQDGLATVVSTSADENEKGSGVSSERASQAPGDMGHPHVSHVEDWGSEVFRLVKDERVVNAEVSIFVV